jgi:2-keto-4-pentenoate hydratase/2-oxohepta-3-ene-1,7-dioic acid hydratase in catechol pathway
MPHWIRYEHGGKTGFGTLQDATITVHDGDMFAQARARAETLPLSAVTVSTPTQASKMVCLWNNYRALAAKLNVPIPPEPLYFLKAPNAYLAHAQPIRVPRAYAGKVVYEGELGIVIGKRASALSESEAQDAIFGYTCVNDVTAAELINKDPGFAQWTRAKSFDTFGVFGPVIATGLDPMTLTVKTLLSGKERQNYAVSDIVFSPVQLVSLISQDMTLWPGDVIACGTSVGVGSMKPGNTVDIVIDGIGTLSNSYE